MKSSIEPLLIILAFGLTPSLYGQTPTPETAAILASAKTICMSRNSAILYPKKEVMGEAESRAHWRNIYNAEAIAAGGFKFVQCPKADLVIKITVDTSLGSEHSEIEITDADSGKDVFDEMRPTQDEESDLVHEAQHFHNLVTTIKGEEAAKNEAAATAAEEARERASEAKDNADQPDKQLASGDYSGLPLHWRHPQKSEITDVWVKDGYLYEKEKTGEGLNVKIETLCSVNQAALFPWVGSCTYSYFWAITLPPADAKWMGATYPSKPNCTVTTKEVISAISSTAISGRSQRVDNTPAKQTPATCPIPGGDEIDFQLER